MFLICNYLVQKYSIISFPHGEAVQEAYLRAIKLAVKETKLPVKICLYSIEQLLDDDPLTQFFGRLDVTNVDNLSIDNG
jgi:hypothetical protein